MSTPLVMLGLLGWSNKRSGVEFYRYDPKIIPRHGSEWGDLLIYEDEGIAQAEGSPVVVVVLPRATSEDEAHDIARKVLEALSE